MGKLAEDLSGFPTFNTYLKSLIKTIPYVLHRPWMRRSFGAQSADKAKEIEMKRCMVSAHGTAAAGANLYSRTLHSSDWCCVLVPQYMVVKCSCCLLMAMHLCRGTGRLA
jgi:hypothetical protein